MLWFAFILYLWNIESTSTWVNESVIDVVICFHLVSLKYWKHHMASIVIYDNSCDLLSSCIFEILKAPYDQEHKPHSLLWFAFILYLWNIESTHSFIFFEPKIVVICFHLVSLKYWKHLLTEEVQRIRVVICFHLVSLKYWKHLERQK